MRGARGEGLSMGAEGVSLRFTGKLTLILIEKYRGLKFLRFAW